MSRSSDPPGDVGVGIVTALPLECAAVRLMVNGLDDLEVPGDLNHYRVGTLPSRDSEHPHRVVVAVQAEDGTRNAAAICTDMARSFPGLAVFVMCGIAGGVPAPHQPDRHVRLGDVVVATRGVVDYDHVRTVDGAETVRRPVQRPSTTLLRADRELQIKELTGEQPLRGLLDRTEIRGSMFSRPGRSAGRGSPDIPVDPHLDTAGGRTDGSPRVHRGAIGSADRLLRDAARRDALALKHSIRAVEMEGSGIAVAADLNERQWFMVRGVADHCDDRTKTDAWHPYAALVAAAYVRALLSEALPFGAQRHHRGGWTPTDLQLIVDALLEVPAIRDDYQRRAIIALLPAHIRNAVPDSVRGRLHVIGIVQTCEYFPDGRSALLDALRLTLGPDDPEFQRVGSVVLRHWSGR
ncbi:effector-associated domain 2-containing protein [Plantactinospora sp. WMMB334]|uniref:effector-associated domain 2-containing protein n=1 Tax=Plantactinospora sp. WMMB334 TaxID=3404119 RepID=UPI003B941E67